MCLQPGLVCPYRVLDICLPAAVLYMCLPVWEFFTFAAQSGLLNPPFCCSSLRTVFYNCVPVWQLLRNPSWHLSCPVGQCAHLVATPQQQFFTCVSQCGHCPARRQTLSSKFDSSIYLCLLRPPSGKEMPSNGSTALKCLRSTAVNFDAYVAHVF